MTTRLLPLLLLSSACAQTTGYYERHEDEWWEGQTAVQGMLGALSLDHDIKFETESTDEPGNTAETSIGTLPLIGIAGQLPLAGRNVDIGFEAGIIFSWARDDAKAVSTGNGTVLVRVDNDLYLTDVFAGIFISRVLANKVRVYIGAGPMMVFGQLDADIEEETFEDRHDSDSDFGAGGYVRGGLEFRLPDGSFLGFGVRAFKSDLDFDDDLGDQDLSGVQGMLTFTTGF